MIAQVHCIAIGSLTNNKGEITGINYRTIAFCSMLVYCLTWLNLLNRLRLVKGGTYRKCLSSYIILEDLVLVLPCCFLLLTTKEDLVIRSFIYPIKCMVIPLSS